MTQRSRAPVLLRYLGLSFAWLVAMVAWPLVTGPHTDPHCYTSASFGFLPAAMVVPFLVLPLYAFSAVAHAAFAFSGRRFEAGALGRPASFTIGALFFIPFTGLATIMLASGFHWDRTPHCFFAVFTLALPWIVTPLVNAWLLVRNA